MSETKKLFTIKPRTEVSSLDGNTKNTRFPVQEVSPVVGMSRSFIQRVVGKKTALSEMDVRDLLEQDAFSETFVPRSKVIDYLRRKSIREEPCFRAAIPANSLVVGDAMDLIERLQDDSVNAVVTSTPYWAMRVYQDPAERLWADGEVCPFGLEQTPEGYIRHSVEVLHRLSPKLAWDGSVWWNIMDSYNTRSQIRGSAVETLRAMQGRDKRSWKDHEYLRYSSGHSYLKDGEQCLIPQRIAQRASRVGYYVKSTISWCKQSSTPEPHRSRVSRSVEYVVHLSKNRAPRFNASAYLSLPQDLGGRQSLEPKKLGDFWHLPTSSGRDGHGAQFPIQLPGRCIAISTSEGDLVLDPFMGAGTTALAAKKLSRDYIGFDTSEKYLDTAKKILAES